jgi:YbbR domain-containing protein
MKGKRSFLKALFADMPTKLICLTAAVILFFFHRINTLKEGFFNVPLQMEIPAGLAAASNYQKNVQITVRGTEEAIRQVQEDEMEAGADLSEIKNPGEYRIAVRVERKGKSKNIEPLEVTVEPQEISIVFEPLMERKVQIIADLRGSPAYGYEVAEYSLSPQSVVIRGARSLVQAASALSTDVIDLTGRTGPFTLKSKVVLPSTLVRIVGDPAIEFTSDIKETVQAKRFDPVEITYLNLAAAFAVKSLVPSLGRIQIQGPQLAVESLRPEQLRLLADLSAVHRPGSYVLRPKPETPENVEVLDYEPKEISVEIVPVSNWRSE